MGALDGLLNQVKDAITQHGGGNSGKLIEQVTDLFGKHPHNQADRNVKPASQDPYGDPADQRNGAPSRNIKPASQDPYGDPADQQR